MKAIQIKKVYIILEGELKIVKEQSGKEELLAALGKDNWIGGITFTRKFPITASIMANCPSTVMIIDKAVFDVLEEKTQLVLLKRLNDLAFERVHFLEIRDQILIKKNQRLEKSLLLKGAERKSEYADSDLVMGIIQRLPKLPSFAGSLATKLLEEEIPAAEVAGLIKRDPSMVAVVLKTVNSAYYGFQQKISDINHAVVLLGFAQLHQLVVRGGIRRTMPDRPVFRELLEHSSAISQLSYFISQASGRGNASQLSTLGLLHDLGRCLLELLKEQNPRIRIFLDQADPYKIGTLLLKAWNLPALVWRSVDAQALAEYSSPLHIPREIRIPVATLHLAHLSYAYLQGQPEEEMIAPFLEEYLALFNWGKLSLAQMVKTKLLPAMLPKKEVAPAFLRALLKPHSLSEGDVDSSRNTGYPASLA